MAEETVEIGGEKVSLADLAGVNLDAVNEVRGFKFPKGFFKWRVLNSEIKKLGEKAAIANECECIAVINCNDPEVQDQATIPGKKFTHVQFLSDMEGLGRQKAYMADTGFKGSGPLGELLNQFTGTEYYGKVVHKRNKDDADNPFVNMDLGSISPGTEMPEGMEAAAPGATAENVQVAPAQPAAPAGGLNLGSAQQQ